MKPVLNYFVPFTNGKFLAQCLMFSDSVEQVIDPLATLKNDNWNKVEYSDIDYWWVSSKHDWFNTADWQRYLTDRARESAKYQFYTCHEDYSVHHIKRLVPESRIITIIPNLELCERNYYKKNWMPGNERFEESRVYQEFKNFKPITADIVVNQVDLFDEATFLQTIEHVTSKLGIAVDLNKVLEYRNAYFKHSRNQP